ncbi:MAG: DNA mismatch repair endonuclease MutL [Thermoplasmata archaeon]
MKLPAPQRWPIRRLPPEAIEKIAAGEVVEGPASVVKELVENAIDAGATEVEIRLEGGGLERIVVSDDGWGIPAEELSLAVERHATSKLSETRDLTRVTSLGFRGEALAAVAQVSRLRIVSRTPDAASAHGLSVEGGRPESTFEVGRSVGTTVDVRDLFFNTPARRKFLRPPAAEQVDAVATIERLYLAHPSIAITVTAGEQEIAQYPRALNLEEAATWVFGSEFVSSHFTVQSTGDSPVRFFGALGRPTVSRGTSVAVQVSVNGRAIISRPLSQAVRAAYQDYLPRTRFPVGAVQLVLDPARVDVNVHPTKREIRIQGERDVADALRRAIRVALVGGPQVADLAGPRAGPRVATPSPRAHRATKGRPVAAADAAPSLQTLLDVPGTGHRVSGTHRHPALSLLGSVFRLYWVAESDGDLVLIDQHAASERVLYDELRAAGRLGRQELMEPIRVSLTARQRSALAAHEETLRASGFTVEAFGGDQFRVRSVPSYRGHRAEASSLPSLLDELADGGRSTVPEGLTERIAASVACHAAIRAGDEVSPEEIGRILEALYRTDTPAYACPHGRPVLVRLSRGRLDGWFLRRAP